MSAALAPLRRERAGIFIDDHRNWPEERARKAYECGFRWALVHAHAGVTAPADYGLAPLSYVQMLKRVGFDVGGWGSFFEKTDPMGAALKADQAIRSRGFGFYCANIEAPFPDARFVAAFRLIRPKFTLWLSSEISNPRDWAAWFMKGAVVPNYAAATCWLPQCYLVVNDLATPKQAYFQAVREGGFGINGQVIKPTIGCYPNGDTRLPINAYIDALCDTALGPGGAPLGPGFSVWSSNYVQDAELDALGAAIRDRKIALV